jgi:hypothetical protein
VLCGFLFLFPFPSTTTGASRRGEVPRTSGVGGISSVSNSCGTSSLPTVDSIHRRPITTRSPLHGTLATAIAVYLTVDGHWMYNI